MPRLDFCTGAELTYTGKQEEFLLSMHSHPENRRCVTEDEAATKCMMCNHNEKDCPMYPAPNAPPTIPI